MSEAFQPLSVRGAKLVNPERKREGTTLTGACHGADVVAQTPHPLSQLLKSAVLVPDSPVGILRHAGGAPCSRSLSWYLVE